MHRLIAARDAKFTNFVEVCMSLRILIVSTSIAFTWNISTKAARFYMRSKMYLSGRHLRCTSCQESDAWQRLLASCR